MSVKYVNRSTSLSTVTHLRLMFFIRSGQSVSDKNEPDMVTSDVPHPLLPDSDKATVPPITSDYITIDTFGSPDGCSNSSDVLSENNISNSTTETSLKPDFSKLKGEIFLEILSLNELHETFKATFGRETSVEDKQWLVRRISMGLSNSCDFSCTRFVIGNNGAVKKVTEENIASVNSSISEDPIIALENTNSGGSSGHDDKVAMEQRAAKRVRKPTKRYIEELSEVEYRDSSGKSMPSEINCGYESAHPHNHVISILKDRPDGKPLVMRQDSLGGSGVQIPYVSRIRRGRPRENFMTLLKLQLNDTDMTAELVDKALNVRDPQLDEPDKDMKPSLLPGPSQQPEREIIEEESLRKHENMDSYKDHSDDNMTAMPTPAAGMKRKHHRPWTLNEVTELVEGVSRFGVGKWSEIKRLAFANCPYRTPVDLKDKWRNLLRATFVQLPAENGIQSSRKQASHLIPAPILLRVRELAEMNGHISPSLNQNKNSGGLGRSAEEEKEHCEYPV